MPFDLLLEYERDKVWSGAPGTGLPPGWRVEIGSQFVSQKTAGNRVAIIDGFARHAGRGEVNCDAILASANAPTAQIDRTWPSNLRGEFIAVLANPTQDVLMVARDQVGVRPLYLTRASGRIALSTSIAALVDLPWVSRDVDERHLVRFLAGDYESMPTTPYAAIETVAPSTVVTVSGGNLTRQIYHQWNFEPRPLSFDEASERVGEAFLNACKPVWPESMVSAEVSGGLDSSSVVGALVENGHRPLVGRILFDDPVADERSFSDAVIAHYGLDDVSVEPWQPTAEQLDELMAQVHVPLPLPNGYMARSLHHALGEAGSPVFATGVGGDDAFAAAPIGPRVVDALRLRDGEQLSKFGRFARLNPKKAWPSLIRPALLEAMGQPHRSTRAPWIDADVRAKYEITFAAKTSERVSASRAVSERWDNITSGRLAGVFETMASLSESIGVRPWHPYVDVDLIDISYRVDPGLARHAGVDRSLQRAALGHLLPRAVLDRTTKAEFSASARTVISAWNLEQIRSGPLASAGLLDQDAISDLLGFQQLRGMSLRAVALLYSTDQWLRSLEM